MKTLKEIEERMSQIKTELDNENADLDVLDKEFDQLCDEKRALLEKAETRKNILGKIANGEEGKEVEKMEDKEVKKFGIDSEEYRLGWAKTLMGRKDLTENEKRAVGDAVTTTATTFVEADESHNGVNNGGLLIPTSVRTDILTAVDKLSPFFRDIRKLAVASNIDLPYLDESDDAEWVIETSETNNAGEKFGTVSLTGYELARDVVVTWKLEKMAVADFIKFITDELSIKMAKALATAAIYGNGSHKATGAIYGLDAIEGSDPINTIAETYKALSDDFRIGAKTYISTNVNIDMVSYKDSNGNYPFINGVTSTKLTPIEVEPFLVDGDIMVGNPMNYIFNTIEQLSIARETTLKGRKTTYGSYGIFDGKPRTGAFKKGSYVAETESV